jgi:peptide deformylase
MPEIVTDQEILQKESEPASDLEIGDIVQQLSVSIPGHALGLAAPQIGIHKRIFLANLSSGSYAFINPEITRKSPDKVPSHESCLSLPGIYRCIERHSRVQISCYKLINMDTGDLEIEPEPMKLKDRDAVIVQHEHDHLNGVLIIHHTMTMTHEERVRYREKKRAERIEKSRVARSEKTTPTPPKLSSKNLAKKQRTAKKQQRTLRRQEKIRVETQERHKAEKDGLFSKSPPPILDAEIKDNQD